MTFKAIIFDMDGLMLDTEPIAQVNWQKALADYGYEIDPERYLTIIGTNLMNVRRVWRETFGPEFPLDEVVARYMYYAKIHYEIHDILLKAGLLELLEWLEAHQIPRIVASSTYRAKVEEKLHVAGINRYFAQWVGGDEITHSKPAPDIFLMAAQRLNILPMDCIVLEDSEPGIRAAHAAGMYPIMIPDLKPPSAEIKRLAQQIFPSLREAGDFLHQLFSAESSPKE